MPIADEIEKLERLHQEGTLSDAEFQQAKAKLINEGAPTAGAATGSPDEIHGIKTRTWCMLLHISQLLAFAGGIGFVAPIVMWFLSKDQSRDANRHGIVVINWMISCLIYTVGCVVLSFVIIGIPLAIVLGILTIVFPIMGALKANDGILWVYPMSIQFIDPDTA